MVVTEAGVCVSQKRAAHLCLLQPAIDEDTGILTLSYPGTAAGFRADAMFIFILFSLVCVHVSYD